LLSLIQAVIVEHSAFSAMYRIYETLENRDIEYAKENKNE